MPRIESPASSPGPLLLVSVRSELEAAAALAGGADILDVKDPARGSLGCPNPHVLEAVSHKAAGRNIRVTTALGEVAQWADGSSLTIPRAVSFAKLGLAGLAGVPDWKEQWLAVRRRFDSQRTGLGWVAVAYVDESAAAAPSVEDIATAAIDTGCAGLLLDTCDKSGGQLFDFVDESDLDELAERMHSAGKFIAAAGRLGLQDVCRLASSAVDIVAVRSAACAKSDRRSTVQSDLVAACKAALRPRFAAAKRSGMRADRISGVC